MNSDRKRRATPSAPYLCRSCKQPVDTVVERHKTMGVWVPLWTAGPCHNPRCERFVPRRVPIDSARSAVWRTATDWKGR